MRTIARNAGADSAHLAVDDEVSRFREMFTTGPPAKSGIALMREPQVEWIGLDRKASTGMNHHRSARYCESGPQMVASQ